MYAHTSENVYTSKKLMWVVESRFFYTILFGISFRQFRNWTVVPFKEVSQELASLRTGFDMHENLVHRAKNKLTLKFVQRVGDTVSVKISCLDSKLLQEATVSLCMFEYKFNSDMEKLWQLPADK